MKDGWVADAARTFPVGEVSPVAEKLLEVTRESLFKAAEQCVPGNRLGDVGHAVQSHVEENGFSVVRSLVGHGIGRSMHEDPQIPNYGPPGKRELLEEGMVLAVEPMTTAGRHQVRMGDDGWAIYSQDGSLAAHFEFTIAVTGEGPRILTPSPAARPPQGSQEHPDRPGAHQDQLQQHDRRAHRPRGQRHRVGVRRRRRLQGLAQVDALRRPGDR